MNPEHEKYNDDREVRVECLNMAFDFCDRINICAAKNVPSVGRAIYDFITSHNPTLEKIEWRMRVCKAFIGTCRINISGKEILIEDVFSAVSATDVFLGEGGTTKDAAEKVDQQLS